MRITTFHGCWRHIGARLGRRGLELISVGLGVIVMSAVGPSCRRCQAQRDLRSRSSDGSERAAPGWNVGASQPRLRASGHRSRAPSIHGNGGTQWIPEGWALLSMDLPAYHVQSDKENALR